MTSHFLFVWMTHSRGSQLTNRNAYLAEVPFGPPRFTDVTCLLEQPLGTMRRSVSALYRPRRCSARSSVPSPFPRARGHRPRMSRRCVPRRLRSGRAGAGVAGRSSCAHAPLADFFENRLTFPGKFLTSFISKTSRRTQFTWRQRPDSVVCRAVLRVSPELVPTGQF